MSNSIPKILLEPEVLEITRLSAVTIWRMERKGLFPVRIKLGLKRVGWPEGEVRDWLANRMADRNDGQLSFNFENED
jgi:prophage regulatory protein